MPGQRGLLITDGNNAVYGRRRLLVGFGAVLYGGGNKSTDRRLRATEHPAKQNAMHKCNNRQQIELIRHNAHATITLTDGLCNGCWHAGAGGERGACMRRIQRQARPECMPKTLARAKPAQWAFNREEYRFLFGRGGGFLVAHCVRPQSSVAFVRGEFEGKKRAALSS
jgi:hypothetical protein